MRVRVPQPPAACIINKSYKCANCLATSLSAGSASLSLSLALPLCCSAKHHYHCDYHQHLLQSHSVKVNALFYAWPLITATACLSQFPRSLLALHHLPSPLAHKVSPELNAFLLYENYLAHFALIAALQNFHIVYIRLARKYLRNSG